MKDSYHKIVIVYAIALLVIVATVGYMVVQKLDYTPPAQEEKKTSTVPEKKKTAGTPERNENYSPLSLEPEEEYPSSDENPDTRVSVQDNEEPERRTNLPEPYIQPAQGIKLKPELPDPLFEGTPKHLAKDASLQDPWSGFENGILVPKDVILLSKDKPVTSSDEDPVIGDLSLVTDGDKEGVDGSYVELGPGLQYIQIDLKAEHSIYAIALWHFHSDARIYKDVVILISKSPDFDEFDVVFNNDLDNSLHLGEALNKEYIESFKGLLFGINGKQARYVRFYSNGSSSSEMNHYIEAEIYGRPAKD